jgi:hypothetical protein
MRMPFQLTVGALIAIASNSVVSPVSASLQLGQDMEHVRSLRKTQTEPQQPPVNTSQTLCDADLAMVSFEYCFYTCDLDEAACQDLIENATSTIAPTTAAANSTNNVTAGEDTSSSDEGGAMACDPDPSGFALVEAFFTASDAEAYCSETCGLDEEECTMWKQRFILADMQRRR